jgi:drug/metabolite transporter (DMT)-like permease
VSDRTAGPRVAGVWTAGAAVLSVALWASTFTLFTIAFRRLDPLAFTGVRYLLLTSLGAAYLVRWRGRRGTSPRRDVRTAMVAGMFGYFLLELTFVLGLDRTSVVASAILVATHPIWGVAFASIAARRRPGGREIAGLAVGMGGVLVFLGSGGVGEVRAGDVLSLGTAIVFGVYGAIIDRLGGRMPQPEMVATSMTTGGLALLVVSIPAMLAQDWSVVRPVDWVIVVYSALGPILLGFVLWAWALKRRGMARTAPFGYLEPIFATVLAFAVLGEWFTGPQMVGGALVLAGVVLAAGSNVEPEVPPPL